MITLQSYKSEYAIRLFEFTFTNKSQETEFSKSTIKSLNRCRQGMDIQKFYL